MTAAEALEQLVRIMSRLRGPGGCPWDAEQTHESLKPYLIEEAYEVVEALERGSDEDLCNELGDLLLQIVFHAEIAAETNRFDITDVIRAISEKMERRHPHVFAGVEVSGTADVLRNWSRIKAEERRHASDRSALAGVPRSMPALLRAQRLGEKAAHVGLDWKDASGPLAKMREELGELDGALRRRDRAAVAAELGDLLFAATSLARHLGLSAEEALTGAADRFVERFRHMEADLAAQRRDIRDVSESEKDVLWEAAKKRS